MSSILDIINNREKYIQESRWTVGFHDRGMGRGDFGVILENDDFDWSQWKSEHDCYLKNFVIKCPLESIAQKIAQDHNLTLE